ncbi:MAG: general secretion pathway protein GspA [Gammaproteobacteria bacterium]|nr:MAG: general secretion pathway protein GspA [Gammaproteobacteria bacterium]
MYEEFYGLKGNPFQLTPNMDLFFGSKVHKQGFAYLQYGLKQAEGFIVITGDIGTGKTTLVERLFSVLEFGPVVASRIVTTQLEGDDIPFMVCSALKLDTKGMTKPQVIGKLEDYLFSVGKEGKRVLLVIDEAQNLSLHGLEELRMLSNLSYMGKPVLQCFLLGQLELQQLLGHESMEQFRQRIIASSHLEPLSAEETRDYILYRLIKSGWKSRPEFQEDVFELIHQSTGGIPRRINRLCNRLLLLGSIEELNSFDKTVTLRVIKELESEMITPDNDPKDDQKGVSEEFFDEITSDTAIGSSEQEKPAPKESYDEYRAITAAALERAEEKIDTLENRIDKLEMKIEYLHEILFGNLRKQFDGKE